jgi:hypothetical protein
MTIYTSLNYFANGAGACNRLADRGDDDWVTRLCHRLRHTLLLFGW